MAQYRPCYKAFDVPQLARPLDRTEFIEAVDLAHQQGLNRLDGYEFSLPRRLIPG